MSIISYIQLLPLRGFQGSLRKLGLPMVRGVVKLPVRVRVCGQSQEPVMPPYRSEA